MMERGATNDHHSNSGGSSWRHPAMPWRWTPSRSNSGDADRHRAIHVGSTLGRFLPPRSCVIAGPRLPLPPTLLPLAGLRRTPSFNADVILERVPTPARADQLIVNRGEEHDITVCFPRYTGTRVAEVEEEVKPVMLPDDCGNLDTDSRQRSPVDVGLSEDAHHTSDNSRQQALDDWTTAASRHVPDEDTERLLQGARVDEVDVNHVTRSTDDRVRPSVVRRHVLSRCGWTATTTAVQRRTVELDARYWERRRKNNEAAKRSRDIRRANERRVALHAALLERENERLRAEVDTLTDDTLRLHYYLLCSRTFTCNHSQRSPNE